MCRDSHFVICLGFMCRFVVVVSDCCRIKKKHKKPLLLESKRTHVSDLTVMILEISTLYFNSILEILTEAEAKRFAHFSRSE
jgi:hypothetical protein